MGSMPDIEFPPEFSEMSRSLSSGFNLDFVTETGVPNCCNPDPSLSPHPDPNPNLAPNPNPNPNPDPYR